MASSLERGILKELKSSFPSRMALADAICEDLYGNQDLRVPGHFYMALDHLLQAVNPDRPERQGVILSGTLPVKLHHYPAEGYHQARYYLKLLSEEHSLFSVPLSLKPPRSIDCEVDFGFQEAKLRGPKEYVQLPPRIRPSTGLFLYSHLKNESYFNNLCGVEIRNKAKDNKVYIANHPRITIPYDSEDSFFVLVYDKGRCFLYNLMGEPVYPREAIVRKEIPRFDKSAYIRDSAQLLTSEWKKNPSRFGQEGRLALIKGNVSRHLDSNGCMSFRHSENGTTKDGFYVSIAHAGMPVIAHITGPNIIFENEGRTVHSYQSDHNLVCNELYFSDDAESLEFVKLRSVDHHKKISSFNVGDRVYGFTSERINEAAGFPLNGHPCAIMYHNDGDFDGSFKLLTLGPRRKLNIADIHPNRCHKKPVRNPKN